MHGHSPSRGGPCPAARVPIATPPTLASAIWSVFKALPAILSAQPGQPALRSTSPALVRAEPSRRRFCGNLRGMAEAALELAYTLRRLAGAEEAGICRRPDGRDRGQPSVAHNP